MSGSPRQLSAAEALQRLHRPITRDGPRNPLDQVVTVHLRVNDKATRTFDLSALVSIEDV